LGCSSPSAGDVRFRASEVRFIPGIGPAVIVAAEVFDEEAEHRTESETFEQENGDGGGRKQDHRRQQEFVEMHQLTLARKRAHSIEGNRVVEFRHSAG